MNYLKTSGIVIKEVNTGEADRIIQYFPRIKARYPLLAKVQEDRKVTWLQGHNYYATANLFSLKAKTCIPSIAVMLLSLFMISEMILKD